MIKTLKTMSKQDKERYTVPRKVQDVIPVRRIWQDGIFLTGNKFSKTYQFSDINYLVASREDKESMFLIYSELLNSLDSGAVTKITINNRRTNKANFENSILMPMQEDFRDEYRREYNQMLLDKATGANGITQEKYITISVVKKDIEEARAYFSRVGADLISHFAALGSKCVELDASERLRILHDFYRQGEEAEFSFDLAAMAKRGHDFKDYICPDSMEKNSDYVKLGDKFCRVLFLKDFASYIKDNMVTELTDFNRNLMFSIDVVPVPTDEAVREVENRLLGVETNITNWQRRQNANNNFSAVVPYDMELQRKESKEFLDDLTTRDQRMMFAVITLAITADTKEQLDSDTEAVLSVMIICCIIAGIISALIAWKTGCTNGKTLTISYIIYMVLAAFSGTYIPFLFFSKQTLEQYAGMFGESYLGILQTLVSPITAIIMLIVVGLCAFIGAIIAKKLLKKHFQKAGMV